MNQAQTNKQTDHSIFAFAYIEARDRQFLEQRIREFKKDLGIEHVHWSNKIWSVKQQFMDAVFRFDFRAMIAVVKNPTNPLEEFENAFRIELSDPMRSRCSLREEDRVGMNARRSLFSDRKEFP